MKHIIGHAWFTGKNTIGIIVIFSTEYGEFKSYIGNGIGKDEEEDLQEIANYGSKFPLKEALSIIKEKGNINDAPLFAKAQESLNLVKE